MNQVTKQLTHEEKVRINDEHSVFSLATLAIQLHTGTLTKNTAMIANSFLKIEVVLRNNPGFLSRFKAAEEAVIAQAQKQGKPSGILLPEGQGEILVPDMISSNPPPDEL